LCPVFLAVGLAAGCGAGAGGGSECGEWNVSRTDHQFQAVSALSPEDVWAVGGDKIVRWDGDSWAELAHPPSDDGFTGVAALAPNNVWAVSASTVEHWNGQEWQRSDKDPSGRQRTTELDLFANSRTDVWLVDGISAELRHWDGRQWTAFPLPAVRGIQDNDDVDGETSWLAASAGDRAVWAVGKIKPSGSQGLRPLAGAIERWTGREWQTVNVPRLRRQFLFNTVSVRGDDDAWAAAQSPGARAGERLTSVIEHWDGRKWRLTPAELASPGSEEILTRIEDIAVASGGQAWAVGSTYASDRGALVLLWNGERWERLTIPHSDGGTLEAVATLPSGDAWAVGDGLLAHFRPCG
jgi:hypothetical protein